MPNKRLNEEREDFDLAERIREADYIRYRSLREGAETEETGGGLRGKGALSRIFLDEREKASEGGKITKEHYEVYSILRTSGRAEVTESRLELIKKHILKRSSGIIKLKKKWDKKFEEGTERLKRGEEERKGFLFNAREEERGRLRRIRREEAREQRLIKQSELERLQRIKERQEVIDRYKDKIREEIYPNARPFIPITIMLILLFSFVLMLPPRPTGFIAVGKELNYKDNIGLAVNDSFEYIWAMGNYGSLRSVRLDGSISEGGSAKVYLEYMDESYLILDSNRLSKEGIGKVSGLAVGANQSSLDNNDESESLNNKIIDKNKSITNNLLEDELIKNNSIINNSLKLIKITTFGGGSKAEDELFEFKISGEFNWDVGYDELCTKWDVNSLSVCYGSSECCALIGLESAGNWNDTFYLSYGRYGASLLNIVKVQVIYANYSVDVEKPYSDIIYSDIAERKAEFYEPRIEFKDICIETCLLPGLNASSYRLRLVVENGSLQIDNIRYSVEKEINISENAPSLVKEIENITIYKDEFVKINLSSYFYDKDGDKLAYTVYEPENISIIVMYDVALLVPAYNFTGKRLIYFTASDGYYKVNSNMIEVNVIERPLRASEVNVSEELAEPRVVINQPVRWVKRVNASGSVVNLSVNISSDALNVSVRDVKENRVVSEDKIKVNDGGVIKNVTTYRAEKRISQIERIEDKLHDKKVEIVMKDPTAKQEIGSINKELVELQNERNKLTGYAVGVSGKGLLTRFFEWLFNVDITGYAVKEKEKRKDGKNKTNEIEVIIEEPIKDVEIIYYTEAPITEEVIINEYTKRIVVSSDVHYESILAYTYMGREVSSGMVRLYHLINGSRESVNFDGFDTNSNGLIDYIEWIVPSLSNQTYELVIEISKAEHLDSSRTFVSDIYGYVKALDGNWSSIPDGHYVRVTFEQALDNTKDITVYARSNESSSVEVYTQDSDVLVAKFGNISSEGWYKVYLTSLNDSYDVFDLRSLGNVEYDYIVDPVIGTAGNISFVNPTPADGSSQTETYVEINVSIKANLSEVKFNWNGTNYTFYNDSLVLFMNFDNISALGEAGSKVVDISRLQKNNGTLYNAKWNASGGKYGGAFEFDGNGDYIEIGNAPSVNLSEAITVAFWVKPIGNTADFQTYVTKGYSSAWSIGRVTTTTLSFRWYIDTTGSAAQIVTEGSFANGYWNHLAMTYDSATGQWVRYINGTVSGSTALSGNLSQSTKPLRIGQITEWNSQYWANASIDELMIFNRSLSAAEINQLYFTNLYKYDTDKWALYVNQSKNSTDGLSNGAYTYSASAKDTAGNENTTETRTIKIANSIPVFLNKYNESWFGDFIIYANLSDYSSPNWNINATITTAIGGTHYLTLSDNDADNIYNGTYIISNGTAVNEAGVWDISIEGNNGSMLIYGNNSINIVALRRSNPHTSIGNLKVTENADGTWQHYLKNAEFKTSGNYKNLTVKMPFFNLPNISALTVTGGGVNYYKAVNNTIIFGLDISNYAYATITFNTTTDLAVTYIDRYTTSHISAREGYNGYMVYNSKQMAGIIPKGTVTKGKIFDYRYVVNDSYNSTYCAERMDVFTDSKTYTLGADNDYGVGWNESEEWLVAYNEANVVFNQSSGNSSDWNDNLNTSVRRTVTFYSNKSYNKHEYFIKNTDINPHSYPFVFGVEPWLEPGGLTAYGDRGIIPDNSTPLGTGLNVSGAELARKWMAVYDNSSFLFNAYLFKGLSIQNGFSAYFLDNNPIAAAAETYPINIGGVQLDTKSVWFEKSFEGISAGNEVNFEYYILSGIGTSHQNVMDEIDAVYNSIGDINPPDFSENSTNASSTTYNGTTVQLNLTISDTEGIDYYILSHNDSDGSLWANESWIYAGQDTATAVFNHTIQNFPTTGGTMGWRVYANDSGGNVGNSNIYTFRVGDQTIPTIALNRPLNNSWFNQSSILFNYTVIGSSLHSCVLYSNFDGTWKINRTNSTVVNNSNDIFSLNINDGYFTWNVFCNTTFSKSAWGNNLTFGVDTVYPNINFTAPTPADGTSQAINSIFVNVSASDTNNISTFIDFDNSLVGWWRMDDVNTTGYFAKVYDYTGKNNGTAYGQAQQTTAGKLGKAFSFDGSGDYVDVGNDESLNVNSTFTITAWIRKNKDIDYQVVLAKDCISNNDCDGYGLRSDNSGKFIAVLANGTVRFTATSSQTLNVGEWYHVVGRYNGTNVSVFVDGVETVGSGYSGTIDYSSPYSGGELVIGTGEQVANRDWNGTIDDVMIFNRSWSAEEIRGLYANQSSRYLTNNFTSLADGTHTFKAYTQDIAGNINQTELRSVTIDTTAPSPGVSIWDDSSTMTVYVNYTKFYANYTDDSGNSINGTGAFCQLSYNKTGRYTPFINMTFNPATLLYELTANGSYKEMLESEERWVLSNGSMPTVPYGNYSFNISCYNSSGDSTSAVANISVAEYPTGLDSFDKESDAETNPLSDDPFVLSGEMTYFYANYSLENGDVIKRRFLNITTDYVVALEAADVDNDGEIEIVVGDDDGQLIIYNSTGGNETGWVTVGTVNIEDIEISDLDNDGKKEIIVADSDGYNLYVLNSSLSVLDSSALAGTGYTVEIGDINNDSYKEIVAGTGTGTNELRVFNYTASAGLTSVWVYDSTITNSAFFYHAIDLYDVDQNGVLDVVVGWYAANQIMVFYGNGTMMSNASTTTSIYSVEADDIDNDGVVEIVAGDGSGRLRIYNSTGGSESNWVTIGSGTIYDIEIADLNNDGRKEIIFVATGTDNVYVVNSSLNVLGNLATSKDVYTLEVGDINNDGYKEIIAHGITTSNSPSVYSFNSSNNLSLMWVNTISTVGYPHALELADLNKDGRIDIVVGDIFNRVYAFQEVGCTITFSDGVTANMDYNATLNLFTYNRTFLGGLYYWNTSCSAGGYVSQINTSMEINVTPVPDLNFSFLNTSLSAYWSNEGPVIININVSNIGDGNSTDVNVSCYWDNASTPFQSYLVNITAGNSSYSNCSWAITSELGSYSIQVKIDPNNNITEMFENNNNQTIYVTINQTTSLGIFDEEDDNEDKVAAGFSERNFTVNQQIYFWANWTDNVSAFVRSEFIRNWNTSAGDAVYALEADDIDNDGVVEIILGDDDGDLAIYNSTGGQEKAFTAITGAASYIWDIEISDLDNDGAKEIVFIDISSDLILVVNSTLGLLNSTDLGTADPYTMEIGDINNDGYQEIIVGTSSGTNELQVYNYTATNKLTNMWNYDFSGTGTVYYHAIDLYDVDNNGVLDVVVGSNNKSLDVFYGNGTRMFDVNTGDVIYSVKAGDIDNDGVVEIVAGDDDGDIGIWNSTGGQEKAFTGITGAAGTVWDIEISDLDNDGKKEIVFIDTSADLLLVVNSSLNLLNSTDLGTSDPYTLEIGDINNDGYKEIIVGTSSGTNELQVYNYTATGKLQNIWNYDLTGDIDYHAIDLYDMDNNSILDIVVGSEDRNVLTTKLSGCSIWFNDSSNWNGMLSNSSAGLYQYNRSFGASGDYIWNVTCSKDYYEAKTTAGENLSIIGPPVISITYPANNTNYSINVSTLNYTVTSSNTLDKCWYSNDGGVWNSTTATAGTNFTDVVSIEGWNNWTVYCNDTLNIIGSSLVTFFKDTTAPTFTDFANQTIRAGATLGYDINASDASGISCFTVNDTTNFKINCSGYLENNTLLGVGLYWLNITVNDTLRNNGYDLMWVDVIPNHPPNAPTLNSPADGSTVEVPATLNVTATDPDGDSMNITFWKKGGVSMITGGAYHSCGVLANGSAMCWGRNNYGQLGDGTTTDSKNPVFVNTSNQFSSISTRLYHSCGLLVNGSAMCWGYNSGGQAGDGTTVSPRKNPVYVNTTNRFVSVSTGGESVSYTSHSCGLLANGSAMCWGTNNRGQVGDGSSTTFIKNPVYANTTNTFVSISAGAYHSCGVLANGSAMCWGSDWNGELGDGRATQTPINNPVYVNTTNLFDSISGGDAYTCGVLRNGSVMCWGNNLYGQLGDGTSGTYRKNPVFVNTSNTFVSVYCSFYHTCGLLVNGSVMCWGDNSQGQLGDGTTTDSNNTVMVNTSLLFESITVGWTHSCGILTNGSAMCWGDNLYGQLGDGTTTDRKNLVLVNTSTTFGSSVIGTANNTANGTSAAITWAGLGQLMTYLWGVSVSEGSLVTLSQIWKFTGQDTTLPIFTDFANQTVEYQTALGYDINASDASGISCFTVNDTTNFKINCSGYLENNTALSVALYWLNITVNDTYGNNNSAVMWVNVTDTTPPGINFTAPTPANGTIQSATNAEINVSIAESSLGSVVYNWNRTNFTYYNDSLVLMMNFDNVSALGENYTNAASTNETIVDLSSYGNNGITVTNSTNNGPTYNLTGGRYGGAFEFDGLNDYINTSYYGVTKTLSFWFKTKDLDTMKGLFGQRYDSVEESGNWQMHWGNPPANTNKLRIYAYGSGGNGDDYSLVTNTTFSENQWYYIVVTSAVNDVRYYVNGILDSQNTSYDMVFGGGNNDDNLVIGGSFGNTNLYPFNGTIDEVRVWNRTLSADEIYQQYVSNLNKFNSTQWYLYVNQSYNATNELSDGNYTYQAFATDTTGNANSTEQRTITIDTIEPSFNNNRTNASSTTYNGTIVQINLSIADNLGLAFYRLTTNDTSDGVWVNGTLTTASGASVTAIFNYTIHNFTIYGGTLGWNVWANDSVGNVNISNIYTLVVQASDLPPTVNITYPADGANISSNSIDLNASVVEDMNTSSMNYYWVINGTVNTTTWSTNSTFNASDGYYNLTLFVYDGLQNGSDTVYFRLDTVVPSWSGNETNASLMKINGNATFNITVTDNGGGLSYYIFSWNGTGEGWLNDTNGTISGDSVTLVINKSTNLSQGNVIGYIWYANDSAGNWNSSGLRTFIVANTAPTTPNVTYPVNNTHYIDIPYVNYTSTDSDSDTITYYIYINGTLNISTTVNATSWNASDGYYNLTVSAGDVTDSSSNSSYVYFTLDSTPSAISFLDPTPSNGTAQTETYVEINVSITEANLGSIVYNWNGTNFTYYNGSLVLIYNFDNVSALGENDTYVFDASGNGNNGTMNSSGPNWTSLGRYGGAFDFDGVDDFINITADNFFLLDSSVFTIETWFNYSDDTVVNDLYSEYWSISSDVSKWIFDLRINNGDVGVWLTGDASGTVVSMSKAVSKNVWHHAAIVKYADNNWKLFVDGKEEDSSTTAVTFSSNPGFYEAIIGKYNFNGAGRFCQAAIDEIRIYNASFSASEIYQHFASNLNKYDADKWNLYVNQSKNATDGLTDGTYTYQAFASDALSNWNNTEQRIVKVDTVIPNITIIHPANNSNISSNSIDLNASATDNLASSLTYYWVINGTLNTTTVDSNSTFNASDGYYNLTLFVSDGVQNGSSTIFFTLDTTPPSINFTAPTPANATTQPKTNVEINVSITESNLEQAIYDWNGTNYTYYNDSLVLMMNFDNVSSLGENSTYVVDVSKYGNYGNVNGSNWTSSGKHGGAFEFDGVDDYIEVPDSAIFDTGSQITASAWIKSNVSNQHAIGIVLHDNSEYKWLLYFTGAGTSDSVSFYIRTDIGGVKSASCGYAEGEVANNQWHLLTGTYEQSLSSERIKMYYDGVECDTDNGYDEPIADGDEGVWIGRWTNGYFNGSIDEVRIWNRSLSSDEVYQQYASNLNKHDTDKWNLYVNQSKNATAGLDDGAYTYQAYASDATDNWNNTEERTITIDTTPPAINFTSPTPSNGTIQSSNSVYVNITSSDANDHSVFIDWSKTLVGGWSFENLLSNGTVYDNSTYNNHGTMVSFASNTTVQGKYGQGVSFNGSRYINTTDDPLDISAGENFTFSAWIKTSSKANNPRVFSKRTVGGDLKGYECYIAATPGYIACNLDDGGSNPGLAGSQDITDNAWHHVVITISGTTATAYIDGNVDGSNTNSNLDDGYDNDMALRIGGTTSIGTNFNGIIDEVRIYSRALSIEEINASYNANLYKYKHNFTNLAEGNYTYKAYAIDAAGNINSTEERSVSVDATAPTINTVTVTPTKGISGTMFNITANVTDNVNVSAVTAYIQKPDENNTAIISLGLNNGLYNGSWNSSGKADGTYVVDIVANDTAGNEREKENGAVIALASYSVNTSVNSSINMTSNDYVIINATKEVDTWLNITTSANVTASVAIAKYSDNVNSVDAIGITELGKYIDIIVDNNTNQNISFAEIRIYYTDAEVAAANLIESTLRLYKYNESSALWNIVRPGGVETTLNYVWGNVSSFSTFGVFGTEVSEEAAAESVTAETGRGGACVPKWDCTEWSECSPEGIQRRECVRVGTCYLGEKPEEERECEYVIPKAKHEDMIEKESKKEAPSPEKPVIPIRLVLLLLILTAAIVILFAVGYRSGKKGADKGLSTKDRYRMLR